MGCQGLGPEKLTDKLRDRIEAEVKEAAVNHLNSKDARTALSHYTDDVIAVTNTTLYPSITELSEDINAFYDTLKEVHLAVWDEIHINVINAEATLVTATCRYSFTNTSDEKTGLKGIWTALYVCRNGTWKIRMRHESFAVQDD